LLDGAGKAGVAGWVTARCSGIEEGKTYQVAVYFHEEDLPNPHECVWLKLAWLRNGEDDRSRVVYPYLLAQEGEWWRLSGTYRAPEGTTLAEVSLSLRHAPQGRVWFDDVSLRQVSPPAPRRFRLATAYLPNDQRTPEGWRSAIQQAGEGKADAVCLGELAQIVPPESDPRPTIPGKATEVLADFARKYNMLIVVSLPEWQGPLVYNTAVIIGRDGQIVGSYRKTHLPQAEVEEGTTPGSSFPVFDTDIGRVGLQICYDHFFPEVARSLAVQGAEIIFTPIMGDGRVDGQLYQSVARARAADNSVFYVTSIRDPGHSLIVDPAGTVLADSAEKPGVVFADVDLEARHYERWLSVAGEADFRDLWHKERRPSIYQGLADTR
jgi:predicted amidohydrolase